MKPSKPSRRKTLLWRFVLVAAIGMMLVCLVANCFIFLSVHNHGALSDGAANERSVCIVLGTDRARGVEGRAQGAAELWVRGKISRIIVSGAQNNAGFNEVESIRTRLLQERVPAEIISMDGEGKRTLLTFRNLPKDIGREDIIIVTDDYHMGRALFLAKAHGWIAKGHPVRSSHGFERVRLISKEILARTKAAVEVLVL